MTDVIEHYDDKIVVQSWHLVKPNFHMIVDDRYDRWDRCDR